MRLDLFTARLRQVIQWTERLAAGFDFERGDYGRVFRQLNPDIDGLPLYRLAPETQWFAGTRADWNVAEDNVDCYQLALRAARAQRVAALSPPPARATAAKLLGQGRILGFETQLSTLDGAPIVHSRGFVDSHDVPPLDTWFHLQEQVTGFQWPVLYCWIPRAFEPVMQEAIDVEILDSYHWLDEADPALYQRVEALL